MAKRYRVTLTTEERDELDRLISRGKADARKLAHARVLLLADMSEAGPGWSDAAIAEALRISVRTIERVRQRFVEESLSAALLRKPSPRVYARTLDGAQEARLIALACSEPPAGKRRWTLRLLAEQMVALEVVSDLSHETVRQVLGENALKPHLRQMWCIPPKHSAEFVCHVEDVLEVYCRPLDPHRPVVCLDEIGTQLIGETRTPLPARPGQIERHDCEYVRHGTANLFLAFEPLGGWREVQVTERGRRGAGAATGRTSSATWWTAATRTPSGSCWLWTNSTSTARPRSTRHSHLPRPWRSHPPEGQAAERPEGASRTGWKCITRPSTARG